VLCESRVRWQFAHQTTSKRRNVYVRVVERVNAVVAWGVLRLEVNAPRFVGESSASVHVLTMKWIKLGNAMV